jgi:hypothetical protein
MPKNLLYLGAGAIAFWYLFLRKSATAAPAATAVAVAPTSAGYTGGVVATTTTAVPSTSQQAVQQAAQVAAQTGQVQAVTTEIGQINVTPAGALFVVKDTAPGTAQWTSSMALTPELRTAIAKKAGAF